MKVLITGVAGQLGSHVADALLARGDEVVGIDNFSTGRAIHLPKSNDFTFIEGTIADRDLVFTLFEQEKPTSVVHAAASYKDPDDWLEDSRTNVMGSVNVIQASQSFGIQRFLYYQTALIYGIKPEHNPITLSHPRKINNSSYAISKGAAEDYLDISGLSYVVFRLANLIGDRCVSGPLPIFYQRLKDGKPCFITPARRDFLYVKDLVGVTLKALDGIGKGAYHFSSGRDFAITELYDSMVEAMNLVDRPEPELRPLGDDEAPSILLDPSKTFADFGDVDFADLSTIAREATKYYDVFGTAGEYTHLKVKG
jgi:UDP-glucose 4-epimerase